MIMLYDGCKTLLVEGTDESKPMTLETLGMLTLQQIVTPVIAMEYFNTASVDGSIKSGILKPFSADAANSYVIMDFSNLKVVWAKDVLEADLTELKVKETFLRPIWNKFAELQADQTQKEQAALDELVADKVKDLISQATNMDPEAFKQQVEGLKLEGGVVNKMQAPSGQMMDIPGVGVMPSAAPIAPAPVAPTPMEAGNFAP